jgi:hypothetical protein
VNLYQAIGSFIFVYLIGAGLVIFAIATERTGSTKSAAPTEAYVTFVALWPLSLVILFIRTLIKGGFYMLRRL